MITCYYCNTLTISIEPIVIKKIGDRISVSCVCSNCFRTKSRFLSETESLILPNVFNKIYRNKTYINNFYENGNVYNFYEYLKDIINSKNKIL